MAGEFVGHGALALQGKQDWVGWIQQFTGAGVGTATQLLFFIGLMDLLVALIILVRPLPAVVLWAAIWGFWTGLVRPLVGLSVLDFIERWANWAAPLALLYVASLPKNFRGWFR